jgi:hypothetical protein
MRKRRRLVRECMSGIRGRDLDLDEVDAAGGEEVDTIGVEVNGMGSASRKPETGTEEGIDGEVRSEPCGGGWVEWR